MRALLPALSARPGRRLSGAAAVTAGVTALGLGLTMSPLAASPLAAAGGGPRFEVVASGLDNPRQLEFGKRGALWIAEAGEGGNGPCIPSPEGGETCFGRSGAITRVAQSGRQNRRMRNLPSLAPADGSSAIGPSDVEVRRGKLNVTIGLGQDPRVRNDLPARARLLGHLIRQRLASGERRVLADIAGFERRRNPDGDAVDSNPNSVLAVRGGLIVADAGGNDLVRVRRGEVRTLAVFDFLTVPGVQFPVAPVPTSVTARNRKGDLFVGQLTGFPFVKGAANVIRVTRPGRNQRVFASDLTNITDVEFHRKRLYVVELSQDGLQTGTAGRLVRITRNGNQRTVARNLNAPFGVALRGDTAYVSTCSVCPDAGKVVAIPLD